MRFAYTAKSVKNKAHINQTLSVKALLKKIKALEAENAKLKKRLNKRNKGKRKGAGGFMKELGRRISLYPQKKKNGADNEYVNDGAEDGNVANGKKGKAKKGNKKRTGVKKKGGVKRKKQRNNSGDVNVDGMGDDDEEYDSEDEEDEDEDESEEFVEEKKSCWASIFYCGGNDDDVIEEDAGYKNGDVQYEALNYNPLHKESAADV